MDGRVRTLLFEAGAKFIPHTFELAAEYNNIELNGSDESVLKLAQASSPDYGGWWFFAFSRYALERAGLPIPVFIRGDDI